MFGACSSTLTSKIVMCSVTCRLRKQNAREMGRVGLLRSKQSSRIRSVAGLSLHDHLFCLPQNMHLPFNALRNASQAVPLHSTLALVAPSPALPRTSFLYAITRRLQSVYRPAACPLARQLCQLARQSCIIRTQPECAIRRRLHCSGAHASYISKQ